MKNTPLFRRVLSVVLVLAMLGSFLVPVASAAPDKANPQTEELTLKPTDPGALESRKLNRTSGNTVEREEHALSDVVRVSIVLDKASTVEAGYSPMGIADNKEAMAYRAGLRADQAAVTARIEKAIGGKLDVKWNLTLAANFISANVQFGQIETIKAVDGVKDIILENRYEPQVDVIGDEPNNGTASAMIGSGIAWAEGYTGAGSKVAVIDTGVDKDHQSFSPEGLEYALAQNAEEKGMSYEDYIASLNLLTPESIERVKGELNANVDPAKAYVNTKIGYAYNYVDENYDVVHINDTQGEHGSHVEGIAAANRFIPTEDGFAPALELVGTQGVAPDAQIVTMKVFGTGGGAYDSDYMVAIEDAIVLGCDAANLSLGSSVAGFGFSDGYEYVLNELVENGMAVSFSAGNNNSWYSTPYNANMYPYMYIDDSKYATGGSPQTYANTLSVASVDNAGQTGKPLVFFGDMNVFYAQTDGYGNEPIATLADKGELEFVLVDGPGVDDNDHVGQEGDQFAALGKDVLEGKVAMCFRGSSSFFAKANAAVAQGAIGVIIINNAAGVINMNLTGYEYTAPAVSILQADGLAIKDRAEAVNDPETGDPMYYTGTLSVSDEILVNAAEPSDNVTVSSFSSWGVPGTLVMKPEIMAPGGNIYSVFGTNKGTDGSILGGTDQYELMSGTSMAAPQVAGMSAVMGQYIRENDLVQRTGLSERQLINSLLMSTAHPVFDQNNGGTYWPVLQVGSGLANVADAVHAQSYILMNEDATLFPDSAKDGKVKAEFGDDPQREGVYEYGFTLYPLGESKDYTLRTDLFTQDIAGNGGYGLLAYTGTTLLGDLLQSMFGQEVPDYDVTYTVNGVEVPEGEPINITEPTEIKVKLALSQYAKIGLDYFYTGGAYIQGYTFVEPAEEGEDVVHSIPLLGYYGSWTDSAMFDRSSPIGEAYGTGKLPYMNNANTNYLTLRNANGVSSVYMGNPYIVEETFPADRLAVNTNDTLYQANFLNIRNAATYGAAALDAEGKVLWSSSLGRNRYAPYYYANQGVWQNYNPANFSINKKFADMGVKEGDTFTFGFFALPEYYSILYAKMNERIATTGSLDSNGFKSILESGLVGDGAAIKFTVKADNTAPVVMGAMHDLITGGISVKAQDDNYIAYIAVMNKSGAKVYAEGVPAQRGPNEAVDFPLDLAGQRLPDTVVLLVADYAGNEVAYEVNLGGETVDFGGTMIAFTNSEYRGSGNRFVELVPEELYYVPATDTTPAKEGGMNLFSNTGLEIRAAEYVDGYVFMAGTDGNLYAAALAELEEPELVGNYSDAVGEIYDLAFNYADGKLYAIAADNVLCAIDVNSGEIEPLAVLDFVSSAYTKELLNLAIDDEGTFYAVNYGGGSGTFLYAFTLEDLTPPACDVNLDGVTDEADAQAILDKVTGKLAEDASFDAEVADVDKDGMITSKDARLVLTSRTAAPIPPVDPKTSLGHPNYGYGGSLAYDHNKQTLFWLCNDYDLDIDWSTFAFSYIYDVSSNYLLNIDPATGAASIPTESIEGVDSQFVDSVFVKACGLFIIPGVDPIVKPTDEASELRVNPDTLNMLTGQVVEVSATVMPWTLVDKSVIWASEDETVAKVSDTGVVTAVAPGETKITVTTAAAPNLVAEIAVTVEDAPEANLKGIIWDENGKGLAASFVSSEPSDWTALAEIGNYVFGALVDDTLYVSTDDTMFAVDADTYEVTTLGGIVSDWIPSDAVAMPADMTKAWRIPNFNVGGLCNNGTYFEVLNPEEGRLNYWDLSSAYADDPMAVIAYLGRGDYDYNGETYENCAFYVMITESGNMWNFIFNMEGSLIRQEIGATGIKLEGVSNVTGSAKASLIYNEKNDFLYLAYYDDNGETASLYAIDAADPSRYTCLGDFGAKVWPVVGLYDYEPATDLVLRVKPTDIEMFEGETAELNVKVKLGDTNEYDVEVADPTVAAYEDGVVYGLLEGETTLTVTTKDVNDAGEKLSATVNVKVKGLKTIDDYVLGQVTDENGARFTYIDLNDLTALSVGYDAPGDVTTGGLGGKTYLAGMGTSFQILDATEGFEPLDWNGVDKATYASYPALDVANYPIFVDAEGNVDDHRLLFTTGVGYLVTPDYRGWNLSSVIPDMAAVTFIGTDTDDSGNELYDYVLLGSEGTLYFVAVNYMTGSLNYQPVFETGITVEDPTNLSMALLISEDYMTGELAEAGLIIANNEDKNVWWVDLNSEEIELGKFGTLEADNISGLVGSMDFVETVEDELPVDPYEGREILASFDFEADPAETGWTFVDGDGDGNLWYWDTTSGAYGGNGSIQSASYINGTGALSPDNWAVSPAIDLSAAEAPVLSVFLKGFDSSYAAENFAFYAGTTPDVNEMVMVSEEEFTATGAYKRYVADLSAFAGKSEVYVAIRHFNVTDMYRLVADNVQILEGGIAEDGANAIPVELLSHKAPVSVSANIKGIGDGMAVAASAAQTSFAAGTVERADLSVDAAQSAPVGTDAAAGTAGNGDVVVTLTEEKATANGMMVVKYDPEALTFVSAESEINLNSINPEEGVITFAYASLNDVPANNTLATLKFNYANDYVETEVLVYTYERGADVAVREDPVVLSFKQEDGDHVWTEIERTEPDCTVAGLVTYKCDKCGELKSEILPALGHDYGEPKVIAPTCTTEGASIKTCARCGLSETEILPALGHAYGEPEWTWTEDNKASATFTCERGDDTQVVEAEVTEETVPATCTEAGKTVYTATVEFEGKTFTDTKEVELPALGHTYGDAVWTWAKDYKSATAKVVCTVCGEEKVFDAVVTSKTTAATETKDGKTFYTATVTLDNGKKITDTKEVVIPKTGHDCPAKKFKDIPAYGTVEHAAIDWALVNGVTKGTSKTTFSPNDTVTRGQAVTFLWRAMGSPAPAAGTVNKFTDVKKGDYYYDAVLWAVEKGITKGTSATTFEPFRTCNREEIMTFVYRAMNKPKVKAGTSPYDDVTDTKAYYYKPIMWAFQNGIDKGLTATHFGRLDNCTRVAIVTFLYRALTGEGLVK